MVSSLAVSVKGGAFDGSVVAASAAWWTHLNTEAFIRSATGRAVLATPAHPLCRQAEAFAALTGVAPFRDVRHVTLYGPDCSDARGVAVVDVSYQATNLVRHFKCQPGYASLMTNGVTVYHWRNPSGAGAVAACFPAPQRILFASDESLLFAAVAVLRSKAPSWNAQTGTLPLSRLAPPGVFFQGATRGCPESLANTLPGTLLRDVSVIASAISETGGQAQIDLQLSAASESAAMQLEQLANGLILAGAISRGAGGGETAPPWNRLVAGTTVTRHGTTVKINSACPPAEMAELLSQGLDNLGQR